MKTRERSCCECNRDLSARLIPVVNKLMGKAMDAKRRPPCVEVQVRYVNGGDMQHAAIDLYVTRTYCPDCAARALADLPDTKNGIAAVIAAFWTRVTNALTGGAS